MPLITTVALLALTQAAAAREMLPQLPRDGIQAETPMVAEHGLTLASLFGGPDPEISRRLASGAVGCPANEIGISNEDAHRGIHTFTAHCKGREWFCTYKYPAPISCTQAAGTTDAQVEERRAAMAQDMEVWKGSESQPCPTRVRGPSRPRVGQRGLAAR